MANYDINYSEIASWEYAKIIFSSVCREEQAKKF